MYLYIYIYTYIINYWSAWLESSTRKHPLIDPAQYMSFPEPFVSCIPWSQHQNHQVRNIRTLLSNCDKNSDFPARCWVAAHVGYRGAQSSIANHFLVVRVDESGVEQQYVQTGSPWVSPARVYVQKAASAWQRWKVSGNCWRRRPIWKPV